MWLSLLTLKYLCDDDTNCLCSKRIIFPWRTAIKSRKSGRQREKQLCAVSRYTKWHWSLGHKRLQHCEYHGLYRSCISTWPKLWERTNFDHIDGGGCCRKHKFQCGIFFTGKKHLWHSWLRPLRARCGRYTEAASAAGIKFTGDSFFTGRIGFHGEKHPWVVAARAID